MGRTWRCVVEVMPRLRSHSTPHGSESHGGGVPLLLIDDRHLEHVPLQLRLELVGRALRHGHTVIDDDDAIGQAVGLIEVLRRQHDRGAVIADGLDLIPQGQPTTRIKTGRWLVEEDGRWVGDQRGHDVETMSLTPGQRAGQLIGVLAHRKPVDELSDTGGAPISGQVIQAPEKIKVLARRELVIDGGALAGEPDGAAHHPRLAGDIEASDGGRPAVDGQERGQQLDHGGLAGSVGAEHTEDGAGWHGEAQPVDRDLLAEGLAQPLGCDDRLAHDVVTVSV